MGENIMKSLEIPIEKRECLGEEDMGCCPNCHYNALILGDVKWGRVHFQVKCKVCGFGENLEKTSEVKWKFVIQTDGLCCDRTDVKVRQHHGDEINHTQGGFYTEENLATVKEKFAKYKQLK